MPESSEIPEGAQYSAIPEQKEFDGKPFPFCLVPSPSHANKDNAYWVQWVKDNRDELKRLLVKYGALVFRGFPFDEPAHFDYFAKAFGWVEFPYIGGLSVRKPIVGHVWTASAVAQHKAINFHHEMAHVEHNPKYVFFFVDVPSPVGGETPIALSHVVHRIMKEKEPEFVARLAAEGLRYVRYAGSNSDSLSMTGRSWNETFCASTKEEAEATARKAGFDIEWLPDDTMKTITKTLPAIRYNEATGQRVWFNNSQSFFMQHKYQSADEGESDVIFPNGDELPDKAMELLRKTCDEVGVCYKYYKNDVMLLDNFQILHSRKPYTPPRLIYASLYI